MNQIGAFHKHFSPQEFGKNFEAFKINHGMLMKM
jgi:hypothetical protein